MKQKLAIAAAFIGTPRLVLLDEAMANLDPASAHAFKRYLLRWTEERGGSVILCTHQLDSVEKLCSRILVLHEGRLVRDWSRDALVAEMDGAGTDLEGLFVRITTTPLEPGRSPA
jgi:ABC-2 type transport system ATP-binding protein